MGISIALNQYTFSKRFTITLIYNTISNTYIQANMLITKELIMIINNTFKQIQTVHNIIFHLQTCNRE